MKKLVSILLFIATFLLAMYIGISTASAYAPSPTTERFYTVKSDYMTKSWEQNHLFAYDAIRVDLDVKAILAEHIEIIDAEIEYPVIPDHIGDIVLSDGVHFVRADWERTSDYTLHVYIDIDDLGVFDGYNGLYRIILNY